MKVIDIQIYRNKKILENLEKRIGELSLASKSGVAKEIKTCFKEWIKISAAR